MTKLNNKNLLCPPRGCSDDEATWFCERVQQHTLRICSSLRSRFPQLRSEELADIWQSAQLAAWSSWCTGRMEVALLENPEELRAWMWTVAYRLAVDLTRKRVLVTNCDEVVNYASNSMREYDEDDVMTEVGKAINSLPPKQKLAMSTFVRHFPESTKPSRLHKLVKANSNSVCTVPSVTRNFQEARKKVADALNKAGFGISRSKPKVH